MSLMTPGTTSDWGTFIDPPHELRDAADLRAALGVPIYSGHRARFDAFRGQTPLLDAIVERIESNPLKCEDQCSAKHYADVFECVRAHYGRINRIVEVGVFLGGASTVFAGCAEPMGLELDLIDTNRNFLLFTYERIRRTFPEAAGRVRLFHGDLPTYVDRVLRHDEACSALVHHDGAHDFTQVVKDLSALSFVKDRLRGLLLQDTHLRGRIEYCNFVDAAIYAVFGFDVTLQPLGSSYPADHPNTEPNRYQGNYFLPDTAEGVFIPMAANAFKYPHPSMTLEEFLPKRAA